MLAEKLKGCWMSPSLALPRAAVSCLLLSVVLTAGVGIAHSQQTPPVGGTAQVDSGNGTGASYWGTIPPLSSTTSQTIQNQPMPVWEGMLVWPYRVITFPLKALSVGFGETLEYLDDRKVLYRLNKLLGPRQGPFGVLMQVEAGGLPGFGGGLALEHDAFFGPSNRFRLYGTTTVTGTHRASLGMRFGSGTQSEVDVGAGFRVRPNARYFGIGYETTEVNESFYTQRLIWAGTSYRRGIGANLYIKGDALISSVRASLPRDDDKVPITALFPDALPVGYGSSTHGFTFGVALTHENAIETGRPARGGSRRLRVSYYRGFADDSANFWTYRADLQQFFQLWYPNHVLALRTHVTWLDQVGSTPIPFQRLMTNDDPDLTRGYRDFRWRDRGMAVLSAEYRWPLWVLTHADRTGADLYLHTDIGQVFSNVDQIRWENLSVSYGFGIRLLGARGFVLRLEYARSNEDNVWRLRGDQIFQFTRGGFFYGRDPVPAR